PLSPSSESDTSAPCTPPPWPSSATTSSASTSTPSASRRSRPASRPSTSPASSRSCAADWTPAGCASPPTTPTSPTPRCTSWAWAPRPQPPPARDGAPTLVVGKSTVPAGTARLLAERLAPVDGAYLLWNPEFLREGFAVQDTLDPDRLVYGVHEPGTPAAERAV